MWTYSTFMQKKCILNIISPSWLGQAFLWLQVEFDNQSGLIAQTKCHFNIASQKCVFSTPKSFIVTYKQDVIVPPVSPYFL